MAVLLVGLLACAAVLAATVLAARLLDFRRLEMALPGPPSFPFLGNVLDFAGVTEETVFLVTQRLWGGRTELTRFSMLNSMFVFVSNPDDLATLFRRKDLEDKPYFFYGFMNKFFPKGLITLNGPEWKRHRKATQSAFHAEVLNTYGDVFTEEAENFVKRIVPFKEEALHDNMYKTLARAFITTAMASPVRPGGEDALVDVCNFFDIFTRALNEFSFKPWLQWAFSLTSAGRKMTAISAKVCDFLWDILRERRAKLDARGASHDVDYLKRRKTLLDVYLDAQMNDKMFRDTDIHDEIMQFMGAAVETSASSLSSTIKLLSLYPDVQEKAYAEVRRVLGDSKRSVNFDDLTRLVYLERVLKEGLRVLPAVPYVARHVHKRTEFAGKVLPAGTALIAHIYGAHRDPRHWPDPSRFDPDRFADETERHPYAFIPFSAGPRNCIGNRYAMLIMKTVLATTLRDYRIDPANDGVTHHDQLHLTFALTLSIVGGTKVIFTPRSP